MDTKLAFAKAIKEARKFRCLTQEDFGDISSRTYMSTLERGLKSPTLDKMDALAKKMSIHPLTLLTLTYLYESDEVSLEQLLVDISREIKEITNL